MILSNIKYATFGNKGIFCQNLSNERVHSGKYCYRKTPMQTFNDTKRLALDKNNEILYLENMSDTQNSSDKLDGII